MFCPDGFYLVQELEEMASNIVEAKVPFVPFQPEPNLPKNEFIAEFNSHSTEWIKSREYLWARIVDTFLLHVDSLWICSPKGQVLKFSKSVLLPGKTFSPDIESYLAYRPTEYDAVDLNYWVIDSRKYNEAYRRIEDLSDGHNPNIKIELFPCDLTAFHGWGLCVKAKDFPKTEAELLKFVDALDSPDGREGRSGRPPDKFELALSLISQHYPEGIGSATVKEVMRGINGAGLFHEKTLARAMKAFLEREETKLSD